MRPFLFAFAAFLLCLGCVQQSPAGAGGGDAAAPVCDGKKSCGECTMCAEQTLCADELAACNVNSGCVCYGTCAATDAVCHAQCDASDPSGAALYEALTGCVQCTQCPTDCAGYRTCS